ncbi:MAG TPA: hypothetical protein VLV88_01085 [Terriglobales bacterium]|nr:hypothetical protein [Terriglobales bacterium]
MATASGMIGMDRMLKLFVELIFVLLGGLVVWLGWTNHFLYSFNPRGAGWLILSAVVIVWGAKAFFGKGEFRTKWGNWLRGTSLILMGAVMLTMSRATMQWVGPLLAGAGVLLAVRGFVGAVLAINEG